MVIKYEYKYEYDQILDEETIIQEYINFFIGNIGEMLHLIKLDLAAIQYKKAIILSNVAVDKWYKSYTPRVYKRNYDLYNVIQPRIYGDNFIIEVNYDDLGWHHQDNDYVGPLVFEEGFHGGPIWRRPVPIFIEEYMGAIQTKSPDSIFEDLWNNWIQSEGEKIASQIIDEVFNRFLDKFLSNYDK